MKKLILLIAIALVAVPVALAAKPTTPGANGTGGKALVAKLSGVNAAANPADRGNVVVRLNAKTLKVCWSFSNLKLTATSGKTATPTAAHIHTGAAGESNASPLVTLAPTSTPGFSRKGCAIVPKETINLILANPKGYYVNVHNESYPAGAIRGQLKKGAPS